MSRSLNPNHVYTIGHTQGYLQAVADANAELKPETLEHYFNRSGTPSRNSPVGNTMVRILAKYPGISFDEARTKAHELLTTAAKARKYRGPVVLSADEIVKGKSRIERAFRGQGNGKALSKTAIPGDSSYMLNHQGQASRGNHPPPTPTTLETPANVISTQEAR